jgi:hypothetical protein
MQPTVLKIYKLDIKILKENILESWVLVRSTLLHPSVSKKNMYLLSCGKYLGLVHNQIPYVQA